MDSSEPTSGGQGLPSSSPIQAVPPKHLPGRSARGFILTLLVLGVGLSIVHPWRYYPMMAPDYGVLRLPWLWEGSTLLSTLEITLRALHAMVPWVLLSPLGALSLSSRCSGLGCAIAPVMFIVALAGFVVLTMLVRAVHRRWKNGDKRSATLLIGIPWLLLVGYGAFVVHRDVVVPLQLRNAVLNRLAGISRVTPLPRGLDGIIVSNEFNSGSDFMKGATVVFPADAYRSSASERGLRGQASWYRNPETAKLHMARFGLSTYCRDVDGAVTIVRYPGGGKLCSTSSANASPYEAVVFLDEQQTVVLTLQGSADDFQKIVDIIAFYRRGW